MCGICGFVNNLDNETPSIELIREMICSLYHRGPDSSGYYRDKKAALGHTRLAIIDLNTGAQPLSNEDGTLWITFNGEIFNYVELRDLLISKGHVFKTNGDTETIIHAWEEWGEDCFCRFNGQWAFAIWDIKSQSLILSRDRHGIRPLYYSMTVNQFTFGSEIKAIFCDKTINREFDPDGLAEIFSFWSTVAPRTTYKGIQEIPPGAFAVLKNNKLRIKPYWHIFFQENIHIGRRLDDRQEALYADELREMLIDSSKLRFTRSDVPVGAYLSGGIDSSITSSIVSQYTDSKLKTFSLRFNDSEFDEGSFQREMADRLGTEHHNVVVSNREIGEIFPEVIAHTERPVLRTAPAPLFLLSKLVRDSGYKVVVTGEGADEVLAGYDIFREAKVRRFIAENPASAKVDSYLGQLYPWMERTPGKTPAFAKAFFSKNLDPQDPFFSHRPRWETASGIMNMFSSDLIESIKGSNRYENLKTQLPENYRDLAPLQRAQWLEYTTLLSGYILSAQGDRMLMGNSVEGRFPFLDYRLVDFANNLPVDVKLKDLTEKYILKKAFSDAIPESILNRPKQPYRAPDAQSFFFRNFNLQWIDDVMSDSLIKEAGIFNPIAIDKFISKCRKMSDRKMSNTDNMRAVGILSTMLCYKQIIQKNGSGIKKLPEPVTVIDNV